MPVAVNCWVEPTIRELFPGVTVMLDNTAAVTVRTVALALPPNFAAIEVWPGTKLVANPFALIVATDGFEEPH